MRSPIRTQLAGASSPLYAAGLLILVILAMIAATSCVRVTYDAPESRLAAVKERGKVICVAPDGSRAFGLVDSEGNHVGFDIDLCRAVAAATLGDADAVELRAIEASERGPVMQSGEVDILVSVTTWTSSRDAAWGDFVLTMFYDGQGFMVHERLGTSSAFDLAGAKVCAIAGTTSELNMKDFFRQNRMEYSPAVFESSDPAIEAYRRGECDAFTTDRSALAGLRESMENPDRHLILSEIISEEPLTPLVPHGDSQWFDIVKTVMSILINAEALEITSDNVAEMVSSDDLGIRRLLGVEGSWGQADLGLDREVAQTVISMVGNYGQIYERHLGSAGIGLPREGGRNALWADAPCLDCPKGGQIYAPPLR